jgi:iron(III) transport system permease protein
VGVGLTLAALIAAPLAAPLAALLADPDAWRGWQETGRIVSLARNTLFLTAGTLTLAWPLGVAGALLLFRTDLPCRRFFRFLFIQTLFIPLPLFTSAWQTVLGSGGWFPLSFWNITRPADFSASGGASWTPWGQGIGSAIWIHSLAGLPWVILLAGVGLLGVERTLEEDALTAGPAGRVMLRVSLPRSGLAIAAAALWLAIQAAGEITVTDVMQVRTFAEEIYTQFVGAGGDPLARAVAVSLPSVLLPALLVLILSQRLERRLPCGFSEPQTALVFHLGIWRWPLALLVGSVAAASAGVPLVSLIWRAGLTVAPQRWSAQVAFEHLALVWRVEHRLLLSCLLLAVGVGVLCAALALLSCWLALGTRAFRLALLGLLAVAWAAPGPIVGLGLKETISALLDLTNSKFLASVLWHGPSFLPLAWVDVIRLLPYAVAIVWPAVRLVPADLRDAVRVDGAGPFQELRYVLWPHASRAVLLAVLAVAVLSLGELSAGKLVSTPGFPGYAEVVFTQMHYGVTNDLAARCLLLLAAVLLGGTLVAAIGVASRRLHTD